jgi:hypothetical protein
MNMWIFNLKLQFHLTLAIVLQNSLDILLDYELFISYFCPNHAYLAFFFSY